MLNMVLLGIQLLQLCVCVLLLPLEKGNSAGKGIGQSKEDPDRCFQSVVGIPQRFRLGLQMLHAANKGLIDLFVAQYILLLGVLSGIGKQHGAQGMVFLGIAHAELIFNGADQEIVNKLVRGFEVTEELSETAFFRIELFHGAPFVLDKTVFFQFVLPGAVVIISVIDQRTVASLCDGSYCFEIGRNKPSVLPIGKR